MTQDYVNGINMLIAGIVFLVVGWLVFITNIILWCCLCAKRSSNQTVIIQTPQFVQGSSPISSGQPMYPQANPIN
jgi:hypothetical protein